MSRRVRAPHTGIYFNPLTGHQARFFKGDQLTPGYEPLTTVAKSPALSPPLPDIDPRKLNVQPLREYVAGKYDRNIATLKSLNKASLLQLLDSLESASE
jgi:hypothetical protein